MLLQDIGKSPDSTFRRINRHLENNYGFKISEDVSDKDLVAIMEQIEEEITDLKIKGNDAGGSSEISKRLLILEGIKSLREFALVQMQSSKLDGVVKNLVDYVVDTFEISGMQDLDFEKAMNRAMDEYRSSRYRFPDDVIEQRVRMDSMLRIHDDSLALSNDNQPMPSTMLEDDQEDEAQGDSEMNGIEEDSDPFNSVGKRASAQGGHAAQAPNTPQAKHAMNTLANPELSLQGMDSEQNDDSDEQVPMIRDKHGRMVPDPFAAQAAERRKGIAMKESLVKNLRRLLETEVSQAEVMMAAKEFSRELQEMVEKIGRLQNEDLPPVTDQMRETYGQNSASSFQTQIYGALQSVMDALYTAKTQVDDAVSNMASSGQVGSMTDMDKDIGMSTDGADMDIDNDFDNIGDDSDADTDEFGGEEALGRSMKAESVLQRKVMEMQRLVAKAKKLKESKQ